jgi:aspartate dehydrogenase
MRDLVMVGIVGCGNLGSELASVIAREFHERAQIAGVYDVDFERAGSLASYLGTLVRMFQSVEDLIERVGLVVEAASKEAVPTLVPKVLEADRDILVTSVGGLAEHPEVIVETVDSAGRLIIPSGVLAGVDALKACGEGTVSSVTLTSRIPPSFLGDAPYVREHDVDIDSGGEDKVIFEGNAVEACSGFPAVADAAVTLAVAGIGLHQTTVRVIVTRHYEAPSHEIEVKGDFGRVIARTENVPSPASPHVPRLAVHSAVAALRQYLYPIKVGT